MEQVVCDINAEKPVKMAKYLLTKLIRLYQLTLSQVLGQHCRFYPSCSSYAIEAIEEHGAVKGSVLAINRLCRCHPFHPGGVDLVPPNNQKVARN